MGHQCSVGWFRNTIIMVDCNDIGAQLVELENGRGESRFG